MGDGNHVGGGGGGGRGGGVTSVVRRQWEGGREGGDNRGQNGGRTRGRIRGDRAVIYFGNTSLRKRDARRGNGTRAVMLLDILAVTCVYLLVPSGLQHTTQEAR